MIALGIVFAAFIGYLALRERGEADLCLLWGMVLYAGIAFFLWAVIMVSLGAIL